MRTIWKFPLSRDKHDPVYGPGYRLSMPYGAVIKFVDVQYETPTLWAEVDRGEDEMPKQNRTFFVICTGEPIPEGAAHVGSYQEKTDSFGMSYVFHVYEAR